MMVHMTVKEGGNWWRVDIHNIDNLKSILNTGHWQETRIYALMLGVENTFMIYDFVIRKWS